MNYSRIKNGVKISVKQWGKVVILTDVSDGRILGQQVFSDHIQAIAIAQAL